MAFSRLQICYEVLRSYREATKSMKEKGKHPSALMLKRIAKIKREISLYNNKNNNGQVTK
jgi:hypothetical protein|tara:strand:+ start:223 stop:402 length:180 start_codon:yes stop_codon:yes gene_type:complete